MPSPDGLAALRERLAELSDLGATESLLGWDQQVTMPPGGAAVRGEVMATVARLSHARAVDPALGELLASLNGSIEGEDAALVRVAARDHDRARRVPESLVGAIAQASAAAQAGWLEARERNDFSVFQPYLERNVELRRRVAECYPEVKHPYDALLDQFEPDLTTAEVRSVFRRVRDGLVPLIAAIAEAPAPPALPAPFDVEAQREIALEIAHSFGFDESQWRFDLAVHPFAQSLASSDIRVTGRFDEGSLTGLFAVMHEVGHGLYEHQVDPALARTTLDSGVSLGVHESQSRLWENLVGRGLPFWRHWYPRLQERFGQLEAVALEDFHRAINAVRPSLIRVEADEATYSLHIILRFELEVALIEGSLAVADLPEAWNTAMKDLLGIDVPDDLHGVLQDIHWAFGELGYFPTYTLGNIIAAQLWQAITHDLPDLDDQLAAGDVTALREWLREHVHRHGRRLMPADLLRQATGAALDPEPFVAYLNAKYRGLYGL
jgi:carboxypeptidase Taq